MNSANHRLGTFLIVAVTVALLTSTNAAPAQSNNRQIGTQYTVTADPLVPRPHRKPCVVALFTNYQFAFFSDSVQNFQFTPPANCPGPWQKVVFEVNFSENAGRQFDRTASVFLGDTNLYFGTTPEPLHTAANRWHVERDVTDYSALLKNAQHGTIVLQNCTTDCPAPYNTLLTGIFTVNADLQFYPAYGQSPLPRTPDVVLPLVQTTSSGINLPAFLFSPSDQLTTTLTLPRNIEQAYLDVIAQSQSNDEQWYACFPNNLSSINELYGCGNTDFRETEITIDGQLAGIAPVSPWVYTGFLPDQWRPIPAVQTLDFVPYRVNLTPFAGLLNDGNPHTIAVSVFNNDFYFTATSSLLLYLDAGSTQVTGALTQNTLRSPSPVVTENLQGTSTVTGNIGVASSRSFTIAGYVNTSHGQVTTSISQNQIFSSNQKIDFDTANFSVLDQNTSVNTSVVSSTTVSSNQDAVLTLEKFSFPITVNLVYPVSNSTFGFTVATTQKYQDSKLVLHNGHLGDYMAVTNMASASDVNPASSSQHYTFINLKGLSYDCTVAAANNVLTSVSVGCK
ncbi:MAG TPA: peptide-N4-asparagine amidase [Terriglobales bacterium]|nr:peptide-N4-asparagine amidase [Terriglobales bacterium]